MLAWRTKTIGLTVIACCFFIAKGFCLELPTDSLVRDSVRPKVIIDEIVVNAPIIIKSHERWAGSISELDAQQLNSGNSYLLSEQLNRVPGVMMQQGTMSTNRITIRGIGSRTPYESNRIKAYWGEMPLSNGDGVTSIEDIALSDIGGVKVLKGPSSALYGAGLGGVVILDPWTSMETQPRMVQFKGEVGSYSTYSNQIAINYRNLSNGTFSLSASQLHTDGYRENSQYDRYNVNLRGKQLLGQHYFHFLYNYFNLHGQIPSSIDSVDFYNNPEKAAESWKAIGAYEDAQRHLLNLGMASPSNWGQNFFNLFTNIYRVNELRSFNRLSEQRWALGIRERFVADVQNINLQAGVEMMMERNGLSTYGVGIDNRDVLLNDNDIDKKYVNLFGMTDYSDDKWNVQLSVNFNRTFYTYIDQMDDSEYSHQFDWVFSPRLGFNYQFVTNSYLFASVGHGFSAPSVEESRMPDMSFNSNIKPEEGWNAEVGYRYWPAKGRTSIDLTFYAMELKNLLVTKRESEAIFYGVNAGATRHRGFEATLIQRFWSQMDRRSLNLNFSYFVSSNKFKEFVDDGEDYGGNHLPGIPKYAISFDANFYICPLHIDVNYKRVGGQYLKDSNDHYYQSYQKVSMKGSVNFNVAEAKCNLYLGIDNLFDEHYASMVLINASAFGNNLPRYYYPGLPFNVYGGISILF